jgi:hypothetical protein
MRTVTDAVGEVETARPGSRPVVDAAAWSWLGRGMTPDARYEDVVPSSTSFASLGGGGVPRRSDHVRSGHGGGVRLSSGSR